LFQQLLDAMRQRPDLQAVIAIGSYFASEEFDRPENTILVDEAPQVALLRRAKVMVRHAGSGCIRESIFFGVPMLLLPITFDAPGNTARAVYHGLALKADFRTVTAQDFKASLEKLLDVPKYSEAAKRMSREFAELENQAPSISIIEKALAGKLNFLQSAQEPVLCSSR